MAIRILALTVKHLPDLADRAQQKAEELIHAFFIDPETKSVLENCASLQAHSS